jgi:hypothetical protein
LVPDALVGGFGGTCPLMPAMMPVGSCGGGGFVPGAVVARLRSGRGRVGLVGLGAGRVGRAARRQACTQRGQHHQGHSPLKRGPQFRRDRGLVHSLGQLLLWNGA